MLERDNYDPPNWFLQAYGKAVFLHVEGKEEKSGFKDAESDEHSLSNTEEAKCVVRIAGANTDERH